MNTIAIASLVKHIGEPAALALGPNGPVATFPDGDALLLNGSPLSQWFLRAFCSGMTATPEARDWFVADDPMRLPAEHLTRIKTPLLPYQKLAVTRMLLENTALWLDMGLGKTLIVLTYVTILNGLKGGGKLFLVVCPTTVFASWQSETEKHFEKDYCRMLLAHGSKKLKALRAARLTPWTGPTIILTSYETLGALLRQLQQIELEATIFDEVSKLKNADANRTKIAFKHVLTTKHPVVQLLSGTPSTKSPEGYYPLYELLGLGRSGSPDRISFQQTYVQQLLLARCKAPDGRIVFHRADKILPPGTQVLNRFYKPIGAKNLDKLHLITMRNAYCLKKSQVAADLPSKTLVVREVQMSEEIATAYKSCLERHMVELNNTRFSFTSGGPHIKLHQIANGFFYDADGNVKLFKSQPKLDELENILEEAGDQKLVIWSPFRAQIQEVMALLKRREEHALEIHGSIPVSQRPAIVDAFQKDPLVRCLVANPDVAGMGLNLTAAHLAVVLTNWFKADVRIQLIDRLHRIGQCKAVTIIDLVMQGTLEKHILSCLDRNIEVEGKILSSEQLTS